jgi:hypothetical protein
MEPTKGAPRTAARRSFFDGQKPRFHLIFSATPRGSLFLINAPIQHRPFMKSDDACGTEA